MPRGYYFWRRARIEGTGCKIVDNGDSNGVHRGRLPGAQAAARRRYHRNQGGPASRTGPHEWRVSPSARMRRPMLPAAATAEAEASIQQLTAFGFSQTRGRTADPLRSAMSWKVQG